jgi:hypothetical protein
MLQLPVGDRRKPILQLLGLQICGGGDAEKEVTENTHDYNANGIILNFFLNFYCLHPVA